MIIGLSGYARAGKDEAAKVLVNEYGFTRVAFADKLREVLYQLNPIVALWDTQDEIKPDLKHYLTVQSIIDKYGWDGYKETRFGEEVRRLLQRLGTEAGRLTLWDSIWVDAAFAGLETKNIVVTDCRFPNEADAILDREGEVWRITRRGVGPANNHPSETSLDDWEFDRMIGNNGTLEAFRSTIRRAYENRV